LKITDLHYAALAATLGNLHASLTAEALASIIGPEGVAEYGFLSGLIEDDMDMLPIRPLRRIALNAIRSLTESTPTCPNGHGLAIERVPGTADWRRVTNCATCGEFLEAPKKGGRIYDFVAGYEVDPDTTHHTVDGLRVPLDLGELAKMIGGPIDPQITEAAAAEGITLPRMLHALLVQKCSGSIRSMLTNLKSAPLEWSFQNGLRVFARSVIKADATRVAQATSNIGGIFDFEAVYDAALSSDTADPARRGLLMANIDPRIRGGLPLCQRPTDQLRSDLKGLMSYGEHVLCEWLLQAEKLSYPRLEARVFRAAREALQSKTSINIGTVGGGVGVVLETGRAQGANITMDVVSGGIGVVIKGR
jgi:hypothetical protein